MITLLHHNWVDHSSLWALSDLVQFSLLLSFVCRVAPSQGNYCSILLSTVSCHSFKFLWRTVKTTHITAVPSGIVACTFSDNLSQNNYLLLCLIGHCCKLTSSVGPHYSLVFFSHSLWVLLPRFQVSMYSSRDTYMYV